MLVMVVARSAYFEHSLLRALLEVVVLITSLQIGYVSGLFSSFVPRSSLLSTTIVATAPVPQLPLRHCQRQQNETSQSFHAVKS